MVVGLLVGIALLVESLRHRDKGELPTPPVPVVARASREADLSVFLSGLGSVTPLSTVSVKSRVDGQLMRVLFEEGQIVARGSLLAEIDRRPFEAQLLLAEGQMSRDRALLGNALKDLARYELLATQDSIARQQYDTQKSLVKQYQGAVETDRAQIETAKLQIVYSRITAPVTGRVGLRSIDPGNIVHVADTAGIVDIVQVRPISIVFSIAEDNLPRVLERLRAGEHPPVVAFDRDLSRKIAAGTLLTVDNQIDPTTGTVRLKALFDNDHDELFPSQFVNAKVLVDVLHHATVIPTAALQRGADRVFVYVVRPDGTVQGRDVDIGPSEGDDVAVARGLAPGELVVVDGADRLREGTRVILRLAEDAGVGGGPR